jgi:rubredoxin
MQVQLKHVGCSPMLNAHYYQAFAESGWAGLLVDDTFVKDGTYDLPDHMFSLDSREFTWECDHCGLVFKARSRPGGTMMCPMCGAIGIIPEDVSSEANDD